MPENYDVVVIGGGAAGLSGAAALARSRRSVLVVDAGEPRNAPAGHVHNFLTRDGTPPAEIYAAGRSEVTRYDGRVETGRVTALRRDGELFEVQIGSRAVTARRLLVATGLRDELRDRAYSHPPGTAVPAAQPARDTAAAHRSRAGRRAARAA
jgi:thioredoxin reductase